MVTGDRNPYNQSYGNSFNQRTLPNTFGTPITRDQDRKDTDFNLNATRAELDFKVRFNPAWEGFAKIRGLYQWGMDDEFNDSNLAPWTLGRGTATESGGVVSLTDPGWLDLNGYAWDQCEFQIDDDGIDKKRSGKFG